MFMLEIETNLCQMKGNVLVLGVNMAVIEYYCVLLLGLSHLMFIFVC